MIRKANCPCGNVIRFRGSSGVLECPQCGVKLKVVPPSQTSSNSSPNAPADPLRSTMSEQQLPPDTSRASGRPRPHSRRTNRVSKNRSLRGSRRTQTIWIALSSAGLLIVVVAMAVIFLPGKNEDSGAPATDSSGLVRIGTYPAGPRVPGTTEFLPADLANALRPMLDASLQPVPPEQNAAPLYLKALSPICADLANLLELDEGQRKQRETAARENAMQIQAWNRALELGEGQLPTPQQLRAFDPLVAEIFAAQRLPKCSFLLVPELTDTLPQSQALRPYGRLIKLRMAILGPLRPIDDSLREYRSALRLLKDFAPGGFVTSLVTLSAETELHKYAAVAFLSDQTDPRHCVEIADSLRQYDEAFGVEFFKSLMAMERIMFEQLLRTGKSQRNLDKLRLVADMLMLERLLGVTDEVAISAMMAMTPTQIAAGSRRWSEMDQALLRILDRPGDDLYAKYNELEATQEKMLASIEAAVLERRVVTPETMADILAGVCRAPVSQAFRAFVRKMAERRILHAQFALVAWRQRHGRSPSSLEEFAGSSSITVDPYGGERLRMVERNGRTIIYSVGPNLRDEQAVSYAENHEEPGDIFFRPPPPQ